MNNEGKFKEWWFGDNTRKGNGTLYAENTKRSYFRELKRLTDKIENNIFTLDDTLVLQRILSRLENGDLRDYNKRLGNTDPSNGLKQYIKFIELKEGQVVYKDSIKIKNIILYGAPGVGKTHNYKNLIAMIEEGEGQKKIFDAIVQNDEVDLDNDTFETIKQEKRVEFVTFHQSYSYEDFIEGFRPNKSGNIELEDGIFKNLCIKSLMGKEKNFYMVIDEINRGNISKIFGELITLIEEDKRDVYEVTLPYSKEKFKVPSNLYVIATMNSTDKSIATIDIALRRRFTFLKMKPNEDLVPEIAKKLFSELNAFVEEHLSEDYKLGHSYFMKIQTKEDLEFVKEYKIKPLLEEYFYVDKDRLIEALKILDDKMTDI